jgi:excinuclease ABC subunit C
MRLEENSLIKLKLHSLPNEPGVYQFFDNSGQIIYVGKAKNLRKRVSSYFLARPENNMKLQIMVKKIADIQHVVTINESDALLLENNIIKERQPRYNVLLKDDKTYPWICVTDELFPRVFLTRSKIRKAAKYFGPYTSISMVKMLLDIVKNIYTIRDCNLMLTERDIEKKKYSVCLEYHIGNCKAPCVGLQSADEYMKSLSQALDIVKGHTDGVIRSLKKKMEVAAKNLKFEEAQIIKDNIQRLESYQSKSVVVNPTINDVDVFSLVCEDNIAYSNFMRVVNGAVIHAYTFELKLRIEEDKEALLSMVIAEMIQRLEHLSPELIVPFTPDIELAGSSYTVPLRGDKLALLKLSEKNVAVYRMEKMKQLERLDPEKHTNRILNIIKKDLHLSELPRRIECFDNSNTQGTNPVASCVVFIDAKPAKNEYRHFNVKTVIGPDDFASMQEIVLRRYSRVLNENLPLPQLIVIDGGKGQLNAALNSLKMLKLDDKIPILGLAKRLEEIYFPNDSIPLHLNKTSETLKILMHIRDEAHRFGITFHRNKRSSNFIKSELSNIKGIGGATTDKLIIAFKKISAIKQASKEELAAVIGNHLAELVYNHFKTQK